MAALAVVETPSGKDVIAEGLLELLKPAVQQLDLHVHSVSPVICSRVHKTGSCEALADSLDECKNVLDCDTPGTLLPTPENKMNALKKLDTFLSTELSFLVPSPESQVELREHIDNLATELCRINEHQKVALDLEPYVKKLLNARRRVVLVNNILQNAQERLRRLNHNVAKETARRKTMLETSGAFTPRSPSKP